MHTLAAQGSAILRERHTHFYTDELVLLVSGIVMEIHCDITGICESPMSSSSFSAIFSLLKKKSTVIPVRYHNNYIPQIRMQRDWLIPPIRSNYENRPEFPFK